MKSVQVWICFATCIVLLLIYVSPTLAWVVQLPNHQQTNSRHRHHLWSPPIIISRDTAAAIKRKEVSITRVVSSLRMTLNTESSSSSLSSSLSSSYDNVEKYLAQFDISTERGFLPFPQDPLVQLPTQDCNDEDVRNLLMTWDKLTTQLPSLIGAGPVRRIISNTLTARHHNDDHDEDDLYARAIDYLCSHSVLALEKCFLNLSFLAHAYIWCDGDENPQPISTLPKEIAIPWCLVSNILGRPPILTYYSYNACNWQRLDSTQPIQLGNICRIHNFLGGMDEEWFSMVHVTIEALAGRAMAACVQAHTAVQNNDAHQVATSLSCIHDVLVQQVAVLRRMEEKSDPYVYNLRVRVPMSGWTDNRIDPEGMTYEGVVSTYADVAKDNQTSLSSLWRRERYFGETGAQSSVIPAIDAALGLSCNASASSSSSSADAERAQALVPYLLAMRQYMPPKHAEFIEALEPGGIALRAYVADTTRCNVELAPIFNECIAILTEFRSLHLGLAQRYVRQWDKHDDDQVLGTGATAFMPYLRAHREATKNHAISITTTEQQELSK